MVRGKTFFTRTFSKLKVIKHTEVLKRSKNANAVIVLIEEEEVETEQITHSARSIPTERLSTVTRSRLTKLKKTIKCCKLLLGEHFLKTCCNLDKKRRSD